MTQSRNKYSAIIPKDDIANFKEKVLHYASRSNTFSFMDNNGYQHQPNRYELLVGIGMHQILSKEEISFANDWILGHLNFETTQLPSYYSRNNFQAFNAFVPITVIYILHQQSTIIIESFDDAEMIFENIVHLDIETTKEIAAPINNHTWTCNTTKEAYLDIIDQIKNDIYFGQYYEINYCIQYQVEPIDLNPIRLFTTQNVLNPAPFAACYRQGDNYLICTSPERFLFKDRQDIYCQPIKGTIANSTENTSKTVLIQQLRDNIKERAENVMIVDLTRNDLAQCCEVGSIEVPELFGIYEFPFVFQMISTVKGRLKKDIAWNDIIKHTYPMGSMTGAPKKTVIEHISTYEMQPRGIYSGSLFYINPDGDFDSNVVIRSLVYNAASQVLQYGVGSAITYDSIADQEWEELQWKAQSMMKAIQ